MKQADLQWSSLRLGPAGAIPALAVQQAEAKQGCVVLLHGLSVSKETHRKELESLACLGFVGVAFDAPHHGERRSSWLEEMARCTGAEAHLLFLQMLPLLIQDTLTVVEQLRASRPGPIGLVGISLGAFAALGATARDSNIDCTVSILGSPDWSPREGPLTAAMVPFAAEAPIHRPERFPPRALLMANAGLDVAVPPKAARRFAEVLQPLYAAYPERLVYHEYPNSPHILREEDWEDLWDRTLTFLSRHMRLA